MPLHQGSSFANGYPRGSTFDISPHRFQPRASPPANRRRRKLLFRLCVIAITLLILCLWIWPFRPTLFRLRGLAGDAELETVRYYDLTNVKGTARGHTFKYSKDRTLEVLSENLELLQDDPNPKQPYGEISIIEKDFGQKVNQDVESRHGFAAQASRRKLMAQARNWLLSAALRPYHSWVYWRDVDVETAPFTILEDLMRHNKDIIVPNVWRPLPDWLGGEQPYDLNSWQESETALALADTLDEDAVIVEGYADILAKAKVFRSGVHFPAFSFQKHAETEGFGKMARVMKYTVVGLPHYVIWHLYEPSVDDIRHMEEMEQERIAHEKDEQEKKKKEQRIKDEFKDANKEWEKDKQDLSKQKQYHLPDLSNQQARDKKIH
ncbi:hypothetical protein XA68_17562 [Ophiocordyceps unilateralis]|uniref:Mannan polymerase II complex ANP1 subunit n=1 Tax=Ophiocordyceps unilateralis TaxID=268505 RepID=A0A2A9P4P6_OPHUN|nr:hypothetical protein XA68_17562 [Ophiocordyceps unilateralis]